MKKMFMYLIVFCLLPMMVFAAPGDGSLGSIAKNIMGPVTIFSDFINVACFIIGVMLLVSSIFKYFEHKRMPLKISMGTVIFIFILGAAMVTLPLIAMLSDSRVQSILLTKLRLK